MNKVRCISIAAIAGVICIGMNFTASAFSPYGGFNDYGKLQVHKWFPASMNDVNHDGDISGPDEGIEILLEGGRNGFTTEECQAIKDAFQVWHDVPTAGIGFHFIGTSEDPLTPEFDLLNYICLAVAGEPETSLVPAGVIGLTITTIADADAYYQGGVGFYITRGQIIESDMILNASLLRPAAPGQDPAADLKGVVVHEAGHFIGIGHTPLNSLQYGLVNNEVALVESPVLSLRDATGMLRNVGATPTMFPQYFSIENGEGTSECGLTDLAPDDIAAVSFIYPRGSQDMFFDVAQEARTQTHPNIPSFPIPGAHIVAWCDADNDPTTPRVPLFSTITGMYEPQYDSNGGRFTILNMFKELETFGYSGMFQATYTFTSNQLNQVGLERQAPPDFPLSYYDAIDGGIDLDPAGRPPFPSEVYHEKGNIFDISKADLGTPMAFDRTRNAIVSVDSGKTMATLLPSDKPMFGDPTGVCWMNMVSGGALSASTPAALRAFRDHVLLKSAMGSAVVEFYYQTSPSIVRYLSEHPMVFHTVQFLARIMEWIIMHFMLLLVGITAAIAGLFIYRRRSKVTVILLLVALVGAAFPASAAILYMTDEQMVQMSDSVVTGTVSAVASQEGTYSGFHGIFSDITIIINDSMKGALNKSSNLYLRSIGGTSGTFRTIVAELPEFKIGEEVVLYLKYQGEAGYVIVGGRRGTLGVSTDTASGKKYITAQYPEASETLQQAKAKSGAKSTDSRIALDDYKNYIRQIVKAQQK